MEITLEEAQAQLLTVQAAIEQLVMGKRITQLKVGSGTFQRLYVYQEINLETLTTLRDELLRKINSLEGKLPTFATNMHIPMVVGKGIY